MNVELLSYTPDALNLLLRTKNTRLGAGEEDPGAWPEEKKLEHLAYMRDTIKSSWEFVDFTFRISEVTRAFTHQLVRSRHWSFAQESQRTVDVRDNGVLVPKNASPKLMPIFQMAADSSFRQYGHLVDEGMPVQDARGILPTNTLTSIIAKGSLRALHDMAQLRLCFRVQGEYQEVFRAMKAAVVAVYPWTEPFIRVACAQTGVCIFPRYTACPVHHLTYNGSEPKNHAALLAFINTTHEYLQHEATPVASAGQTKG